MARRSLSLTVAVAAAALAVGPAACSGSSADGDPRVVVAGAAGAAGSHVDMTAGAPSNTGGSSVSNSGASGAADAAAAGVGGAPLAGAGGAPSDAGSPELPGGGANGECGAVVQEQPLAAGIHVTTCTAIEYATNPPSSGEHYPVWADFGVYDFPLPRGFWVHNLEHGAVVVTYNCPAGCADEVAQATAWLAKLTPDAACPGGPARVLLVPDPKLDVRWAASSWGFTLRADCFDAATFTDFYLMHAGQPVAPEYVLCGTGADFRAPGADTCGAK
jgi:Protein of unknown function (DUF3105)